MPSLARYSVIMTDGANTISPQANDPNGSDVALANQYTTEACDNIKGDDIKIDVSYAKGSTKQVISTSGSSPNFAMFSDSGFGYQSVGFGATTDGVYFPGAAGTGGTPPTTAPGARGAPHSGEDASGPTGTADAAFTIAPLVVPLGSPVWATKPGMTRWKVMLSNQPFRARNTKLFTVWGADLGNSSILNVSPEPISTVAT